MAASSKIDALIERLQDLKDRTEDIEIAGIDPGDAAIAADKVDAEVDVLDDTVAKIEKAVKDLKDAQKS